MNQGSPHFSFPIFFVFRVLLFLFTYIASTILHAQDLKFNQILNGDNNTDFVLSIAQDKYGFIWLSRQLSGIQRYDGRELKSYQNDPGNSNSPASNYIEAFIIDADNIFWLGTIDKGLDRFDPATNTFKHYRHNEKDELSIVSDRINILFADRAGNIWIGTNSGLDMLDKKTGRFTHYVHKPQDKESLSHNVVRAIYEDRAGTIWIGCGQPFTYQGQDPEEGGLNRLNKVTGKFTRYMHDHAEPASIADNKVRAIFEDSKGNFWVGTRGDGLHIMDREKGTFKHYYYDAKHPERLSRPPQLFGNGIFYADHISFITEDATGRILIGAFNQGINYFNPADSTIKHYGLIFNDAGEIIKGDSATGLKSAELFKIVHSREGIMWLGTLSGHLYTVQPVQNDFSFHTLNTKKPDANSLYCEPGGNILWIGTDQGLFRKDLLTGAMKVWVHDPRNKESLCNDTITSIKPDDEGRLWLATYDGLTRFDPLSNRFKVWKHDKKNPKSLHSNNVNYVFVDNEKTVWAGFTDAGIDKMDMKTETFTNFQNELNNSKTLSNNYIFQICEDQNGYIWIATDYGLEKMKKSDGIIYHYLPNESLRTVMMDAKGVIWTASVFTSAFRYDSINNNFQSFRDVSLGKEINKVLNIIEDKQGNLWFTQRKGIVRLDERRESIKVYHAQSGIHANEFGSADNYVNEKGELFLGDQNGYYHFSPALLKDKNLRPSVILTSFSIGDKEVGPGKQKPLSISVSDAQEIKLDYFQNNFAFEFVAINYMVQGDMKYLFKLENYEEHWHNIGTEHKAYFYNIPPGKYVLWVRAISEDGAVGERKIAIAITPPWWRTWWAYTLFAVAFIALVWTFIYYRSRQLILQNRRLENKVTVRTKELQNEKEKVEVTLSELKSTQAQLIQSEKMASLGQLTAGIAHEIQNPLNFVNNFSEINQELIEDLKIEKQKDERNGQLEEEILNDIAANEEKINHHGKKAASIVKAMLEHSRTNTGQQELTDINALAGEYLRLAYHGFRAKDKSFNVTMNTEFDSGIDKVNMVPQEIGRVLLNIYNNAFYALSHASKPTTAIHQPTISVTTKKEEHGVLIIIKDNGLGIPQQVIDKIFQPFFTTKPTGEGTGLGLSLSFDIVKAHGGEIKVISKEGIFTEFVVSLPFIH